MAMAKKKSKSIAARLAPRRIWIQLMFLVIWLDPLMLRMHGMCGPVFHCYSCPLALFSCPIGVLANFSALHVFPFIAVGVLALTGALLGGFVCGWLCPFGLFQDLVAKIPTPKFTLPGWMGYFRYVVLGALVLAIPYWLGKDHALFICRLCPAGALEAAFPNTIRQAIAGEEVIWPTVTKMAIFGGLVVAMLFTYRPWCTVLCPLGAVYTLCNSFSLFYLRVREGACNDCGRCETLCRYGTGPRRPANDRRCIRCLDCTACNGVVVTSVFERDPPLSPRGDESGGLGRELTSPPSPPDQGTG